MRPRLTKEQKDKLEKSMKEKKDAIDNKKPINK